jgi:serine phosphatase RsbU (regulator of sigma subunit)
MARSVSIRWSLLASISILIVLLSGAILGTTVFGERRTVETLSRSLIAQTIDQTVERLQRFFDPVTAGLLLLRSWGEAGLLSADAETLNPMLVPLIRPYPQISALIVADQRGREYMLLRAGDEWRSRETRRDTWGTRTRWLEWTEAEATPVVSWRDLDYDPRTRPWYQGAGERRRRAGAAGVSADPVHWTEPYTFFTLKAPGITASIAFDASDGLERVVGVDVLLDDISEYTTSLRPSPHGEVSVLSDGNRVIGLPRDRRFADPVARRAAILKPPEALGIEVVANAVRALGGPAKADGGPVRFPSAGQPWWGQIRNFELSPERALSVVVAVPETDLLAGLGGIRRWILALTAAALALGILWAAGLARRYSRPIEALVRESDRISQGDLEGGATIRSTVAEVQRLASAHERMRGALRSLLKMERDLQLARQIQLSTLPDALPSVPGFELDAWSEPAEATGGDTYDVIGLDAVRGEVVAAGPADRAVLLLADAVGHGIGPALLVTQVRAMLRMAVRAGQDLPTIVQRMNAQLAMDCRDGHFVTAWLGLLDGRTHTLTSVSCGQAPILHYWAGRRECASVAADALPLGIFDGIEAGMSAPRTFAPGDVLAVLSDGIFEARNGAKEQFGTERVMAVIRDHHHASGAEILAALRAAVASFTNGAPADDDRTAIIIKCRE